ncbi:MAG: hypothetical protein HOI95_16365 [Chromatiales bacterium]|jgi:hypothetical protein|nr:hypothetical protein [Chromatiales bacterium]
MKMYTGDRTIDGIVVTADGQPLAPRLDIAAFSKNGFEWTYEGPESRQLALAILVDCLGDEAQALALSESFMRDVVAFFDNTWEMSAADVHAAVAALD